MSPWLYLVLAHLVADFVLQPYPLVKLKERPIGLVLHSGIHGLLTAAVVVPTLPRGWLIVALVTLVHYFIDYVKVRYRGATGPASLAVFLLDQATHLAALAVILVLVGVPLTRIRDASTPELTAVLFYAIPYVTVTFAGAILLYQLALAYRTRSRPEDLLLTPQRVAGYAERGLALTVVLFAAPVFWMVAGLWYALRLALNRGRFGKLTEIASGLTLVVVLGLLFRNGMPR